MMRVIKVYGKLAKHLGQRSFKAVARTPSEAVKFLLANFPSLRSVLSEGEYMVSVGRHQLPLGDHPEYAGYPLAGSEPIRIVPVVSGAGGNTGSIVAGIALIGASFLFPGAGMFGAGMGVFGPLAPGAIGTLTTVGTALSAVGAGLVLTGIAGMISPTPKTPEMDSDPRENFSFSGVQNVARSGVVVPVIYGEVVTGSITISAGLNTEEI
jgi:predicted phage tail protein|tara:strand:+ start:1464 stop:2093 length:630 start_codon:yes stop_codon:yes gene_type:complete